MDPREAAAEERRRRRKLIHDVLNLETEELVRGALGVIGLEEGSAEWEKALNAWREYRRQQERPR